MEIKAKVLNFKVHDGKTKGLKCDLNILYLWRRKEVKNETFFADLRSTTPSSSALGTYPAIWLA